MIFSDQLISLLSQKANIILSSVNDVYLHCLDDEEAATRVVSELVVEKKSPHSVNFSIGFFRFSNCSPDLSRWKTFRVRLRAQKFCCHPLLPMLPTEDMRRCCELFVCPWPV